MRIRKDGIKMAVRKVSGIGASKGKQEGFPTFPAGTYVFKVDKHMRKEMSTAKGSGIQHTYMLTAVATVGGAEEQKEMVNKRYSLKLYEMLEDHVSFEEWGHLFTDELKSLLDSVGFVIKNDNIDDDYPIGKTFIGKVKCTDKEYVTDEGETKTQKVNEITKYMPDNGEELDASPAKIKKAKK
jgi:hypothetical protein